MFLHNFLTPLKERTESGTKLDFLTIRKNACSNKQQNVVSYEFL